MGLRETMAVGGRAEADIFEVLQQYTRYVYRNVRIDTLFARNGTTEVDVLAALGEVLLVVEVKHISCIDGSVFDKFWTLTGAKSQKEYSTLNVLVQNRLHVNALKNAWFTYNHVFPRVMSCVVVPNGCVIPEDVAESGVLTYNTFASIVPVIGKTGEAPKLGYGLDFLIEKGNGSIIRPDFVGGRHG